jgi:hypothetical protein
MKSGKQRRAELQAKKQAKRARSAVKPQQPPPRNPVRVNPEALAPDNSYGAPDFVLRGHYLDAPFQCQQCGKQQVWTPHQQKWWYEVAKGGVWTTARFCRPCRRRERQRREAARQAHVDGIARKQASVRG